MQVQRDAAEILLISWSILAAGVALRYSLCSRDFQSRHQELEHPDKPSGDFFSWLKRNVNFFKKIQNHSHVWKSQYVLNTLCRNPPSHCTVTREWNITQLLLCILLFFMCFHSFSSNFLWFPALVEHWQHLPIIAASLVCCQSDFKPSAYSSLLLCSLCTHRAGK